MNCPTAKNPRTEKKKLTSLVGLLDALTLLVVDSELLVGDEELRAWFLARLDKGLGVRALAGETEHGHIDIYHEHITYIYISTRTYNKYWCFVVPTELATNLFFFVWSFSYSTHEARLNMSMEINF